MGDVEVHVVPRIGGVNRRVLPPREHVCVFDSDNESKGELCRVRRRYEAIAACLIGAAGCSNPVGAAVVWVVEGCRNACAPDQFCNEERKRCETRACAAGCPAGTSCRHSIDRCVGTPARRDKQNFNALPGDPDPRIDPL